MVLTKGPWASRYTVFFATSALASVALGRVVERVGSYRGMCLAVVVSAASLLAIATLAGSW